MSSDPGRERQDRVAAALKVRSTKLVEIYRAALDAFSRDAPPGQEAARVAIICHCMRELMNGLPSVMSDSAIPRPKPSSGTLVERLPKLLANHPDLDLGLDQDLIPVPRAVARAFAELRGAITREQGRNRMNAAALVTGMADTKHPAIGQWMDTQRFFVGWAHLDRNHEEGRSLPSQEALLSNMRVVEDVIEVRTALFFENLRSIRDLLVEANAVNEDNA